MNIKDLSVTDFCDIIKSEGEKKESYVFALAKIEREKQFANKVYIRGLMEISNICKQDCLYCGIRKSNDKTSRYRMSSEEILETAARGKALGIKTFVLQGGEDPFFSDEILLPIIEKLKSAHPEIAITLSLGERSKRSYKSLHAAGANRYLLRHESADISHYASLHPKGQILKTRMQALYDLKEIGFQTGAGFMVGTPGQTPKMLAAELVFLRDFQPEMIGIGPFIPHAETPLAGEAAGDISLSLLMLALARIVLPKALIPATTALASLSEEAQNSALINSANVLMPNLSPFDNRKKYSLYNGKKYSGAEGTEELKNLGIKLDSLGLQIDFARGDHPDF